MKKLRINFSDFYYGFNKGNNTIINILKKRYDVSISLQPDILFYSCFGNDFLRFPRCLRVFITGENISPDFNFCDYAYGFEPLDYGDKYLIYDHELIKPEIDSRQNYTDRKFCNFIYFNLDRLPGQKLRQEFCIELSKYKRIDCPGKSLNNMKSSELAPRAHPNAASSKRKFISNYKFTIAFENNTYPGYISEKIKDPLVSLSVPIYWGSPDIDSVYNSDSFIWHRQGANFSETIEKIIYYDTHDDEYMKMLQAPIMSPAYRKPKYTFEEWLFNIVENGKFYPRALQEEEYIQPWKGEVNKLRSIYDRVLEPLSFSPASALLKDKIAIPEKDEFIANPRPYLEHIIKRIKLPISCEDLGKSGKLPREALQRMRAMRSALERSALPRARIDWSSDPELERQYRELLSLLWPQDAKGINKIRIGGAGDGGYVMAEPQGTGYALSLGVGPVATWDLDMAKRGWKVWQYDGTLAKSPAQTHPNITFFPKNICVGAGKSDKEISIAEILARIPANEQIILQMDIEGAEWDIFESLADADLRRFSQIVVEIHHMNDSKALPRFRRLIKNILVTHAPIHFHYNNNGSIRVYEDFLVSSLWEISFLRRDSHVFSPSGAPYPTPLDSPNVDSYPELYIGDFGLISRGMEDVAKNPPRAIPPHLIKRYTMDGRVPVQSFYFNGTVARQIRITAKNYEDTFNALKNGAFQYYGHTLAFLLSALKDFPINSRKVMVAGLVSCNCDAIALAHGASEVIVADYNPPVCEHPRVRSIHIDEFMNGNERPQAALSISSYEHDGLGRYGDPLDPDGDLRAMRELRAKMSEDGLLYLAVPVGRDCLAWNAHRIYGTLRLPILLKDWAFLASYGLDRDLYKRPEGAYEQPVLVLSADSRAVNIPSSATELQKAEIAALAKSDLLDRQFYIEKYPDILAGKMDAVSHYVLYGAKEGRNPSPAFNTKKYMAEHPDIDWNVYNPLFAFLLERKSERQN